MAFAKIFIGQAMPLDAMIDNGLRRISDHRAATTKSLCEVDIFRSARSAGPEPLVEAADSIEKLTINEKIGAVQRVEFCEIGTVLEARYGAISLNEFLNFRIILGGRLQPNHSLTDQASIAVKIIFKR